MGPGVRSLRKFNQRAASDEARPKKLLEADKAHPRSVHFPDAQRGITVHAALREAILAWLRATA